LALKSAENAGHVTNNVTIILLGGRESDRKRLADLHRRLPPELYRDTYKWRHLIDNSFSNLKELKGTATRCCKKDRGLSVFIPLAATVIHRHSSEVSVNRT
jgi:hypothetical protein